MTNCDAKRNAPLAGADAAAFQPFARFQPTEADAYFARELGAKVREASTVGWSPENPGKVIRRRGQAHLEPYLQPLARRHHGGAPRRAFR